MDQNTLLRLADTGLVSLPPSKLGDLASWCREFGEASANSRYLILSDVFDDLNEAFDQFGAFDFEARVRVDAALAEFLPEIVAEVDNETATALALALRRRIQEDGARR